jgi:hypothetical protein
MEQKDKELLLKDLCARLPYKVKGIVTVHANMTNNNDYVRVIDGKIYDRFANLQNSWYDNIPCIKPYLRPMSSMTEEEKGEYNKVMFQSERYSECYAEDIDWLNAHHFDYRNLIGLGLALEAPDNMYNIK